jgi:hypothetical protein
MNTALLRSVQRTIARFPDRFCAAQWAFARNADRVLAEGASPEGFRCCIAGHVLLESGRFTRRDLLREGGFHTGGALWNQAAAALNVGDAQCRELFFPSQWEHPFKKRYYLCARDEEAEVATAYLDHFVQKHGAPDSGDEASVRSAPTDRPPRAPAPVDGRHAPAATPA